MKIAIVGSRDFDDYRLMKSVCDQFALNINERVYVLSGGAKGADKLAERYAHERGFPLTVFEALWSEYGKAAGPIRNQNIVDAADFIFVFWNGVSPGSKDVINKAKKAGKQLSVVKYPATHKFI